jgi:hypothetical protein
MRALGSRNFNARNAQHVIVSINFKGTADVVVIRDGDTDPQLSGVIGDFCDRVAPVGVLGVKMQVNHGMVLVEQLNIWTFKANAIIRKHLDPFHLRRIFQGITDARNLPLHRFVKYVRTR